MQIILTSTDITAMAVDAIVNAANSSLLGGGGVDGAIHRKGGKAILEDCLKIRAKQGGCGVGEAVITTAGNLPSTYVIHTVGPVWNGGNNNEPTFLQNCYLNCVRLAVENGVKTIAFPNISTGIYKFPKDLAARIAVESIQSSNTAKQLQTVYFTCFDEENFRYYKKLLGDE